MRIYIIQARHDVENALIRGEIDKYFQMWDQNDVEFEGSEVEFHNFSSELARAGLYGYACRVLDGGIVKYPYDTDLLADYLHYGMNCGNESECKKIFDKLDTIDDKRKSWRAFDFSIDYILNLMKRNLESESDLKEKAFELVDRFKKSLPDEELAYLSEYNLCEAMYEKDKGIEKLGNFLKDRNRKAKVAPRCHMKYIDIMLARGEYKEVIMYATNGIAEAAQEQETVDTGYFFYALALAKDALWLKTEQGKENEDREQARIILKNYQTAYETLDTNKSEYFNVIKKRYRLIANVAGIDDMELKVKREYE